MAYVIEAHVIDPDEDRIRMTVSFWGEDKEDAEEAQDQYAGKIPELVLAEKEDRLVIEEAEIEDDDIPEIEDDEEEEQEK
jgi:hypothetical protein